MQEYGIGYALKSTFADATIIKVIGATTVSFACQIADMFWGKPEHARYFFVLFVLLTFDTLTGVWKNRAEFSSAGLRHTFGKLVAYGILICLGNILTNEAGVPAADSWMFGFVVVTEVISIVENLDAIGYPVPGASQLLGLLKGVYVSKKEEKKDTENGGGQDG